MARHLHRSHTLIPAALVALTVLATACSDDGPSPEGAAPEPEGASAAPAVVDDPESPYCRTALEWGVYAMTPHDDTDPAALEAYMGEYVEFARTAAAQAPEPVAADWELNATQIAEVLYPLFESFGFDQQRAGAEATPDEVALLNEPPADVAAAQDRIHEYESSVCAASQPALADVTFEGAADSAYCRAAADFDAAAGELAASGFEPAALEAFVTGDAEDLLARSAEAAPAELADDVAALVAYEQDVRFPLFADYDYDLRRILLEAPVEERVRFQYTDPAVVGPFTRTSAYDQQVCGL